MDCNVKPLKTMRWEEGGTKFSDLLQALVLPQALAKVRLYPKCVGGMSACGRDDVAEEFASSWCFPSCVHEITRVVRTVDTSNGKLSVDLIAKVDGKDGQVAGADQANAHETSRVLRTGTKCIYKCRCRCRCKCKR